MHARRHSPRRTRRLLTLAAVAICAAVLPASAAAVAAPATRDVLVVGNNWDGTADIVDPHALKVLTRLNIVPDLPQRMAEIAADPAAAGFFTGVNLLIGEGHNQYVDDAFTSPDGRRLYVSRPSLADVVALDLGTRRIVWRAKVDGYRADHMAISPDGRRLLVSASTAAKVHVIDTDSGALVGEFASGDQPHENNYSADGARIYHASIGTRLHAARRARARRAQGQALLPDRGCEHERDRAAASTWPGRSPTPASRRSARRCGRWRSRPTSASPTCSCRSCTASPSSTCSRAR